MAEWAVLSGQIPPVVSYVARQETGLSLVGLAERTTTLLVPARDTARGLDGLGGTGKTSLASALAYECHDNQAAHLVLWVTATGQDAVITGYAQALRDLDEGPYQGESREHAADRFLDWLRKTDRPWLVVLDELTDPAAVDGLWPTGPAGRVLVATQNPDAVPAVPGVRAAELGVFSPREALTYLFASVNLEASQRAGALELATEIGFSPMALRHAAAFLTSTELDCRQYHGHFTERRQLAARDFPDGLGSTVAATWSLSWELADQLPPQGLAGRALALISMLAPHGIPYQVLSTEAARAYLTEPEGFLAEDKHVRTALSNLSRTGLVAINEQNPARTVLVHEMVQALTRQYLPAAEAQRVARAAADALAQAWSDRDTGPSTAQALRDCTAKLREITGTFLLSSGCHPVLLKAGQSLDAEGLTGPAVTYWEKMASATQQVFGAGDPQTVAVRDLLGAACEASGRHDKAIAVYENALADQDQALGPSHPDTRAARDRLTRTYVAAGRADDAISLAERTLVSSEATAGPNHPDTLTAHAHLASAYLDAGWHDKAIDTFRRGLAGMERVLGANHPEAIAARGSLITAYRESGRFKEAISLAKRTLADRERASGPDHPDTITARASLASAYRDAKKPKDAIPVYQRVVADRERTQSPEHPDTILARCDLAVAYLSARKFGLSIPQYERALDDAERGLGHDHPITQSVREDLNEAANAAWSVLGIDLRSHRPAKEDPAPHNRSLSPGELAVIRVAAGT